MSTEVYLDHAATTPLRSEAQEAWLRAITELRLHPGNPAALHKGARGAKRLLEDARESIAHNLGADRAEVIFTSGATEANALAIVGGFRGMQKFGYNTVQVSPTDHPSSWNQATVIEREGGVFKPLTVDENGVIDPRSINADAGVVSFSLVCSETGTLQPVADLVTATRQLDADREGKRTALVHSDACQALHTLPVDLHATGLDLITVSAHKIGGPVGVGALAIKRGTPLQTDRPGGDQELKHRSGTVDVAGACAFAAALEAAVAERDQLRERCEALQTYLWSAVRSLVASGQLPAGVSQTISCETAPTIAHLSIPTAHPEAVLLGLDQAGVWASAGSACHAGVTRPSRVLMEMGRSETEALGVIRLSFGPASQLSDVERFLKALPLALNQAMALDKLDARKKNK
ncbi:MAG: aminotransferase class V-fold PLP-dependent enzyme [Actinomycetaceae bacterium]|nr:aminotransferase class V-fold PLP-dependent enzyme [Actinomycetaceae bacterium]